MQLTLCCTLHIITFRSPVPINSGVFDSAFMASPDATSWYAPLPSLVDVSPPLNVSKSSVVVASVQAPASSAKAPKTKAQVAASDAVKPATSAKAPPSAQFAPVVSKEMAESAASDAVKPATSAKAPPSAQSAPQAAAGDAVKPATSAIPPSSSQPAPHLAASDAVKPATSAKVPLLPPSVPQAPKSEHTTPASTSVAIIPKGAQAAVPAQAQPVASTVLEHGSALHLHATLPAAADGGAGPGADASSSGSGVTAAEAHPALTPGGASITADTQNGAFFQLEGHMKPNVTALVKHDVLSDKHTQPAAQEVRYGF